MDKPSPMINIMVDYIIIVIITITSVRQRHVYRDDRPKL